MLSSNDKELLISLVKLLNTKPPDYTTTLTIEGISVNVSRDSIQHYLGDLIQEQEMLDRYTQGRK